VVRWPPGNPKRRWPWRPAWRKNDRARLAKPPMRGVAFAEKFMMFEATFAPEP
jgi:hypothetical protein